MVISWLGVFLAVPTKRQMINIEQLPFPSGIAAATTLRSLHGAGGEAARQARALFGALGLGAVITWLRDADGPWMKAHPIPEAARLGADQELVLVPDGRRGSSYPRIETVWGTSWIKLGTYKDGVLGLNQVTMSLEGSLLFIAAGAIIGFRQAWSLMLGAVVNYVVLAPIFLRDGDIEAPSASARSRAGACGSACP